MKNKSIILIIHILFVAFIVTSCKNNRQQEEVTKIVNEWVGKNLKFCCISIQPDAAIASCTNVEWNKQPVEPGKTASIRVEMRPDETGYFRKSVEVHCNTNESPVKLTITGTTI